MTRDHEEFLQVLNRHQVEYAIIGGKAVQSYGSTRKSDDLDVWINPTAENANKMVASVKDFIGAKLHPSDFTDNNVVFFGRNPYRIDIHKDVEGLGRFPDHYHDRVPVRTKDGTDYSVVSPQDLLTSKKAAGRPKDLRDVEYLEREGLGISTQKNQTQNSAERLKSTFQKVDFELFKQQIDLVDYAKDRGYIKDLERSGGNSVSMYRPEDGGKNRIVIYTKQRGGVDIYFNPNDGADKGTVVQFQHRRGTGEWKDTIQALQGYLGVGAQHVEQNKSQVAAPQTVSPTPTREQAVVRSFDLKPLNDNGYLKSRGLSSDTINAPEFENAVFNRAYFDRNSGKQYNNTVFPIKNEQGTVALIVRNEKMNKVDGTRGDGLWISNPKVIEPGGKADRIIIAESPIDAMSFHQLKPPADGEKRLYIGTAGNLSTGAPDTLQKLVDRYQPRQIVMANDNDNGGFRNNINLVGRLRYPGAEESNNIQAHISLPTPTQARLTVSVSHPDQATGKKRVEELTERFSKALNKNSPDDEPEARISVKSWQNNRTEFEVSMPSTRQNMIRTQNELVAAKGLQEIVALKLPHNKDFTEDLQKGEKLTLPALPGPMKQEVAPVLAAEGPKMAPKFDLPSLPTNGIKR